MSKDIREFINKIKRLNESFVNEEVLSYIPSEQSKKIINDYTHYKTGDEYYPKSQWARWFLSQDRKSKEYIARNIQKNPTFRNALLSNWYDKYVAETGHKISFDEFLETEIDVYRGETSRDIKYGQALGFDSYTPDIELAKRFARDGVGNVITIKVKPKDTYGLIDSVGNEREVLIPTKYSEEFLKNEWDMLTNDNIRYFDYLNDSETTEISILEKNKEFEKLITRFQELIEKYRL